MPRKSDLWIFLVYRVGINVAKARVDVAFRPANDGRMVSNDGAGIILLVSQLKTEENPLSAAATAIRPRIEWLQRELDDLDREANSLTYLRS